MYFRCAAPGGAGAFGTFPPDPPFTSALADGEGFSLAGKLVLPKAAPGDGAAISRRQTLVV